MILIDKYAYCNKFQGIHPMEKFIFSMGTMVLTISLNSLLVSCFVVIMVGALLIFRVGIPWKFYSKIMLMPISFLLLSLVTVATVITKQPIDLLYFFPLGAWKIGITKQGLITAELLFFKAMAAVSCLYFLSLTTPIIEIMTVLRKLKVPELFLELMSLIYRFIFVLMETADRIYISQSSRLGYSSVQKGYKSLGHLIGNIFIRAFKRSQDLYNALEARGYNGQLRVMEKKYVFSLQNILLIVLLDVFLVVIANLR